MKVKNPFRKENLQKVKITNTEFYIDPQAQELREVGNKDNRIPFVNLHVDAETGKIPVLFDHLTKNLYRGWMPSTGIPPKTERADLDVSVLTSLVTERQQVKRPWKVKKSTSPSP